jgi:hypothetical protein
VLKVYGTMSPEVLKQHHEEMLREAESNRLKKALRAERKRPTAPPVGFDSGVGADEDWRPHPQVLKGAETNGLEQVAMMA